MPIPTRRLALVALVAAVVVVALDRVAGFFVVVGALAVLALVDWALATRPGVITIERDLPEVIGLGAVGEVLWEVANPTGRTQHLAFSDELAPSLGAATRRARVTVPAAGSAVVRTRIQPTRRGRFVIATLTVRVDGPLGLASRQAARQHRSVLRVYPPFRSRDEAELRINRARILEVGLRSAQGRGGGTEFDQLREYSVDDEFRRIDWSATARLGKAIVRTYRAERNQTVISLLDNGRVMAGRVDDVPRVEHAMDAVMMMTAVATRLGRPRAQVALAWVLAKSEVAAPIVGATRLEQLDDAVAALTLELSPADIAELEAPYVPHAVAGHA